MKILILANNQKNVDAIKADINAIEEYENRENQWLEIGNLDSHEVHEVNDVISCKIAPRRSEEGGTAWIAYKTDRSSKKKVTEYDYIIVYERFLKDERKYNGSLLLDDTCPIGIVFPAVYEEFYGA